MYKAPDVIKVDINVEDVFAAYSASCSHDEFIQYTDPCTPSDPRYNRMDYLELGLGHQCYSIELP